MYFDKPGPENTEETLKLARARADEIGIKEIVLASTKGVTAEKALEIFNGFSLTSVTYHCGFKEPFKHVMKAETRKQLEDRGVHVISATHALSGIERSVAKKHSGIYPALLIADTLKLFGQGTKVAVEVAIMASDAGTISGKDIVSIGGSGRGADTALVIKPAGQSTLFDLKIRETICKPGDF